MSPLGFFAHGYPDIGIQHIGAAGRCVEVFGAVDGSTRPAEEFRIGLVGLGSGNAQFEAQSRRGPNPAGRHVASPVAHEGDDLALDGLAP